MTLETDVCARLCTAAGSFYNATIADKLVRISTNTVTRRDQVVAKGDALREAIELYRATFPGAVGGTASTVVPKEPPLTVDAVSPAAIDAVSPAALGIQSQNFELSRQDGIELELSVRRLMLAGRKLQPTNPEISQLADLAWQILRKNGMGGSLLRWVAQNTNKKDEACEEVLS